MPTFTVPKGAIAKGPGTLFYANPGTSLPDYTVAGSVFSVNTWTGWTQWGITKNGSVWKVDLDTVPIKAEEYVDDIDQVIKGRAVTVDFELMNVTAALAVRATNRPTPSTTGSGTTLRTTVKLPQLGAEQYQMIGWQSTDDTERIVAANAFQIGTLEVGRHKGEDVATLKVQFKLFPDSNGDPIAWDFAGATRA
jgi:hypothetical protein